MKNSVIILIAAVVYSTGSWTNGVQAEETGTVHTNEKISFFYAFEKMVHHEDNAQSNDLNIGINTADGEKGFEENESVLTSSIADIFTTKEQNGDFINNAEGNLELVVSNPDVISLEEEKQTKEKAIFDETITEKEISVYGQTEGAAFLYLNAVNDGQVTTLGKVEMEVR